MWVLDDELTDDDHLILKSSEPNGSGGVERHAIPWGAIGTWGELLGLEEPGEVLDTILAVTHGDVEVDWEPVYEAAAQGRERPALPPLEAVVRQGAASALPTLAGPVAGVLAGKFQSVPALPPVDPLGDAIADKVGTIEAAATTFAAELKGQAGGVAAGSGVGGVEEESSGFGGAGGVAGGDGSAAPSPAEGGNW